jgi:hypothetical protein
VYFVFIYEKKRMKPVEIVLRRREDGRGRMMEGVKLIKIYHKHICKYCNVSPCTIKIIFKKRGSIRKSNRGGELDHSPSYACIDTSKMSPCCVAY